MSYDLDIGNSSFNYTWNLGDFFREYIKYEHKEGLEALDGLTGSETMPLLRDAILTQLYLLLHNHSTPSGESAMSEGCGRYLIGLWIALQPFHLLGVL